MLPTFVPVPGARATPHDHSYFKSGWLIFDFAALSISLMDIIYPLLSKEHAKVGHSDTGPVERLGHRLPAHARGAK